MITKEVLCAILESRDEELQELVAKRMDASGKSAEEILLADPFLAGRIFELSNVKFDIFLQD